MGSFSCFRTILLTILALFLGSVCPRPSPRELDGVTQPKSDVTKDRQQRRLLIRRRLPFAGSTNVVYPPVNFLANGKPGKIFVNGAEYQGEPTIKPPTANKDDDIAAVGLGGGQPTTLAPASSPITWLTGHFPFNGLPANIFYYPSPPQAPAAASPVTWISSAFGGLRSAITHSMMPANIYLGRR